LALRTQVKPQFGRRDEAVDHVSCFGQEGPAMRRAFLASLVVAALAASGGALAVEAGADNAPSAPPGKHTASTKPKRAAVPLSAAIDTPSTELPAASIHRRQPPPPQSSWTGVYVGVGAGVGN
jgi:hypothetical protein